MSSLWGIILGSRLLHSLQDSGNFFFLFWLHPSSFGQHNCSKSFSKDVTLNWIHSFPEVFFFLFPKSVDIEIMYFSLGVSSIYENFWAGGVKQPLNSSRHPSMDEASSEAGRTVAMDSS